MSAHNPVNDGATRFCFVRHGETEWNAERRLQGHIDIGLNDTGLGQAVAAGRWLARYSVQALYGSDLKRAWNTAQLIAEATGLVPQPMPALRERHCGIFEGLTYDQARVEHADAFCLYDGRDPDYALETGESLKAMFERVRAAITALEAAHRGQTVVAVVHGGVLDIINRFVRGNPLHTPRDFLIPNAGLNWVRCQGGVWQIELWGDTRHLEDGALDELPA